MGKIVSIAIGVFLQISLLAGGHIYFTNSPKKVAIVVDSSYGLTTYRNDIIRAIEKLDKEKYTNFYYGTDKTYLGEDANIDSLFRVNFGKLDTTRLDRLYPQRDYDERYLVSFTDVEKLNDWIIINVNE